MPGRTPKIAKLAELLFGGLAKATIVVAGIVAVMLAVLGGGDGLTDLPATRKQWCYVFLFILAVVIGTIAFNELKDFRK